MSKRYSFRSSSSHCVFQSKRSLIEEDEYVRWRTSLRLIDCFPCPELSVPDVGTLGFHTYTNVFQDGGVGGLEFEVGGAWRPVPASVDAVISWDWCAAILTNDAIKAKPSSIAF
jgi:hypothetical protein